MHLLSGASLHSLSSLLSQPPLRWISFALSSRAHQFVLHSSFTSLAVKVTEVHMRESTVHITPT